jgi:hypothetical protein
MALSAPVRLSGEDKHKVAFTMPAKATNLNRYGAAIHMARQLLVGSTVAIRNTRGSQVSGRVVAHLAASQEVSAYGVEFVGPADLANGFWGISFPPLENRSASGQIADQTGIVRRRASISNISPLVPLVQQTAFPGR